MNRLGEKTTPPKSDLLVDHGVQLESNPMMTIPNAVIAGTSLTVLLLLLYDYGAL